jgi:Antitoxin SocA-like, Panacea domain
MLHYAHVGTPITGATYRKRAPGPTCDQLLSTLRDLDREGALAVRDADYFGFRKKEYVPLREPEIERLSDSELSLLDDVIEFVCRNNTAKTISDYSHNRAWEMAEFGDVLPYHSVFLLFPTQVSPEAMEWASGEVKKIEAERSHNEAVGSTAFADFRNRILETRGQ